MSWVCGGVLAKGTGHSSAPQSPTGADLFHRPCLRSQELGGRLGQEEESRDMLGPRSPERRGVVGGSESEGTGGGGVKPQGGQPLICSVSLCSPVWGDWLLLPPVKEAEF